MGVLLHVIGDAFNNLGVIVAALVIWLASPESRFYADPGISMCIALMILATSIPLVKNSGKILMQSAPKGVDMDDVKHDLEKVRNVHSSTRLVASIYNKLKILWTLMECFADETIIDRRHRIRTRAPHLAPGPGESHRDRARRGLERRHDNLYGPRTNHG